jgi:hypothetical protein
MWLLTTLLALLNFSIVPSLASGNNADLEVRQQSDPYFVNGDFSQPLAGSWSISPKHDGRQCTSFKPARESSARIAHCSR